MAFQYTKENLSKGQKRLQRILEMIPGVLSWSILGGMTFLSFYKPVLASIIAIAFIFYWFLRLIYMTMFLVISFFNLRRHVKTDWLNKIAELNNGSVNPDLPDIDKIYHLIILPVAKEPGSVLEPVVDALALQTFSTQKLMVVFGVEETAPDETKQAIESFLKKYKNVFSEMIAVYHPAGIPGEARVKGANASYAAKHAADVLKTKNINFENVMISCFDADTVVCNQYFACLTYFYLITPDRNRASYQPIPVYNNNIWNVPGFSRVMEIGSSFFQLIEATNPEKLVTFSSHSLSFKALVEMDYWPKDMISDDSAIFWKAYLHYQGRYRVIPLPITVSMDATAADSRYQTFKNVYKQRRRWAYGVENFPILMRGFMQVQEISLNNKIRHIFKMLEGHVAWATWGFLLTTLSWLPAELAGGEYQSSIIYYNEPHVAGTIFRLSTFSLAISIILSIAILPRTNAKLSWLKKLKHIFEWFLMPFVLVFLSALPALDAQTRLMLGKYMEFWVTDKNRKTVK